MRDIVVLPLLAAVTCFLLMLRFQNAVFVLAPVIAAGIIVPAWRHRRVLAAFAAGIVVAAAEWIGESYAWYGGPVSRLHLSARGTSEVRRVLLASVPAPRARRAVVLPTWLPATAWQYPWLSLWWLALLGLIILGILVARRLTLASSLVAVAASISVLAGYVLFEPFAAPRYLVPVLALLAIPAADGIGWLVTVPRLRTVAVLGVCAFLLTGLVTQHYVRSAESNAQRAIRVGFIESADRLRALGARPPCIAVGHHRSPITWDALLRGRASTCPRSWPRRLAARPHGTGFPAPGTAVYLRR